MLMHVQQASTEVVNETSPDKYPAGYDDRMRRGFLGLPAVRSGARADTRRFNRFIAYRFRTVSPVRNHACRHTLVCRHA